MLEKVSVDMKALAKSEILSSDINVAFDCSGKKRVQYSEYKTMCKLVILVGLSLNTMGTGQWSCISLLWLWLISQADYNRPKQQC